ncbi:MAG: ParB/RepB/Spo0J family partition protein, partial [Butyrivibrio sp.]|nr:ParB/RepB/Spo0J family partition protein [Butyrivibrio sp.]
MASRVGKKIEMTSLDELLCVPSAEGTQDIEIRMIFPFKDHPFKVLDDEKMDELVDSIKMNGVLTPVIVRPAEGETYEMISGHRRLHAAKRAG